ncbi:MAG TPA: hypothetical protein VJ180_15140 [Pyrinomonadaceae bacterium]|nr:hypothetical protein [Pyrinomonadaceae bacterium]
MNQETGRGALWDFTDAQQNGQLYNLLSRDPDTKLTRRLVAVVSSAW